MSRRLQTIVSTGEITQKMQNIKNNCLAESQTVIVHTGSC